METVIRIREASPSELLAERLEREASHMPASYKERADDYRRQAKMLRDMIGTKKVMVRDMFTDNFFTNP